MGCIRSPSGVACVSSRYPAAGARPCSSQPACSHVAFAQHLVDGYNLVFGKREPDYCATLRAMAHLAVERISSSDALYHDVQHTIMVTPVGQTILRGRIMVEEVTPEDWLHFTVATLCHDLGYLRGVCAGDRDGRYVTDTEGATSTPRAAPRMRSSHLPYRARQDLRPAPLQRDHYLDRRADRPGDRADPLPDPGGDDYAETATEPLWSAPPT